MTLFASLDVPQPTALFIPPASEELCFHLGLLRWIWFVQPKPHVTLRIITNVIKVVDGVLVAALLAWPP
jgi:hypothetical protein